MPATSDGSTGREGRVLVTGGAGFIGSHVADAFLAEGFEVEVLDDMSTGRRENVPRAARLHELDVRSREAAAIAGNGGFDAILHLAAQIDVRKSVADPVRDASLNIIGTLNLLEAVRAGERRPRFVLASTGGAVYGDFVTPPNEEDFEKDPESPYAVAKLAAEYYMAYYARVHGMDTAALRFANVYGPRQDPHGEAGVVAIFCNRILDGKPLTIFGDGKQTRDYVYVGDVARAVVLTATAALPPAERLNTRAFNVGTGVATSVIELAERLRRAAGSSVKEVHAPARPGEQQQSFVRIEKAGAELGWRPSVTLERGIADTYAWFAAQRATART
ncbi:MAG: NAD-dependent epimerase/dehydratase family protein [Gemmatimonadaceae bacterium]